MTSLIVPSRRRFITGLVASFAAPAIIRIENLMPVRTVEEMLVEEFKQSGNCLLTMNMITRQAIRLFLNNNKFIRNANIQYELAFSKC